MCTGTTKHTSTILAPLRPTHTTFTLLRYKVRAQPKEAIGLQGQKALAVAGKGGCSNQRRSLKSHPGTLGKHANPLHVQGISTATCEPPAVSFINRSQSKQKSWTGLISVSRWLLNHELKDSHSPSILTDA
eukprot:1160456-Pelagomonas_calceolata.AAC.6